MDLSKYRLKDNSELKELMLNQEFKEYGDKVYRFLDNMPEDSVFRFAERCTDQKLLIWFIKIACVFVTTECHLEYDINEEFTEISRRRVDEWDLRMKKKYFENLKLKADENRRTN